MYLEWLNRKGCLTTHSTRPPSASFHQPLLVHLSLSLTPGGGLIRALDGLRVSKEGQVCFQQVSSKQIAAKEVLRIAVLSLCLHDDRMSIDLV